MVLILGIDPGSRTTGYGFITADNQSYGQGASGCIKTGHLPDLADRLRVIYGEVHKLVLQHRPQEVAIEDVFISRSPSAALKLGHARAAALLAAANCDLPISEYQPRKVKKSVVGTGGASKQQVQLMVRTLLQIPHPLQEDTADAFAVAICHAHYRNISLHGYDSESWGRRGKKRVPVRIRRGRVL